MRVPSGAKGVLLKLNSPKRNAHAERLVLLRLVRSRFRVRFAWGTSWSHLDRGKLGSHDAKPALKWVFQVWIARLAKLLRCMLGGTS